MKKLISVFVLASLLILTLASCGKAEKSYKKLDEHITSNSAEVGGVYELTLGTSEAGGLSYTRVARKTANEIELLLRVSDAQNELRSFSLYINKASFKSYKWVYRSSVSDSGMNGIIKPKEYLKAETSLFGSSNTSDAYEAQSMACMAKDMCDYLLESLKGDLASLKIDAVSFGFKDYKD